MDLEPPPFVRRITLAACVAASAVLLVAGCSAPASPEADEPAGATSESPAGAEADGDAGGEPQLPADFPENVFITDGELLAASGGSTRWAIEKSLALVEQVRVAVDGNVTSYGFTIDEFVDGDAPSWRISNDSYVVAIDVADDQSSVSYVIEAR